MRKAKCRCGELRGEVKRYRERAELLQIVLERILDNESDRRALQRQYELALIQARGLMHTDDEERAGDD